MVLSVLLSRLHRRWDETADLTSMQSRRASGAQPRLRPAPCSLRRARSAAPASAPRGSSLRRGRTYGKPTS